MLKTPVHLRVGYDKECNFTHSPQNKGIVNHVIVNSEFSSFLGLQEALDAFSLQNILKKIHVFRCHDYVQLIALSHTLPGFIKENSGKVCS